MRFKATDVFDYYKPSRCARRVALKARNEPEQDTATPFAELLRNLGRRHEATHLAHLSDVVNLAELQPDFRERRTLEAIRAGVPAVYQARFRANVPLDGETCELIGEPDFLIRSEDGSGFVIRDSKLARNPDADRHAGIPLQLQVYGYLYELATGAPPAGLEVHAGSGEIVPIDYRGEAAVLHLLREQRAYRERSPDAYEPVGWSKCDGCGFEDRCWAEAEAGNDVSLLPAVTQKRARELHALGITSIRDVPVAIADPIHREVFYQGKRKPRLTDAAVNLLRHAESFLDKKEIVLAMPSLPRSSSYAVLDLEGVPQYADDLDKTYLWGLEVFGERPSPYLFAEAGFGPDGDREGWLRFLELARGLLAEYDRSLPIVHWSSYERARLGTYAARYGGDPLLLDAIRANMVDLLSIVKKSVVLPLPSYGLKVVEKHVNFDRKLSEADGAWSIVRYIEATETSVPAERAAILGVIRAYNEEDLRATSAVMEWLRNLAVSLA